MLADVIARYHRLKGEEVFFLTGVDQHGQKVQQSAEKAGVSPQQFVDEITAKFIALWEKLEVRYDVWAATTDPLHKKCVQGMLQRLYDEKQIYKDKQEGYYSIRQEQFLTDKERGPDGEFGPEWGQVEHRVEENYYFRLAQHKDWLLDYLRAHPDCVTPDFRQTELINAVEKLSGDLCISRPKSRLSWGIELPFDPDYVNYVWFDALTNYISFIGYDPTLSTFDSQPATFREKWPALHILGKDILIPAHGIYWPIMLHALGFPDEQMPKFLVHGWWNVSGTKMSKSLGNVVDPDALADKYGVEALRYYLVMRDIVTGKDADFSEERSGRALQCWSCKRHWKPPKPQRLAWYNDIRQEECESPTSRPNRRWNRGSSEMSEPLCCDPMEANRHPCVAVTLCRCLPIKCMRRSNWRSRARRILDEMIEQSAALEVGEGSEYATEGT